MAYRGITIGHQLLGTGMTFPAAQTPELSRMAGAGDR
jgi:hypothetical protein